MRRLAAVVLACICSACANTGGQGQGEQDTSPAATSPATQAAPSEPTYGAVLPPSPSLAVLQNDCEICHAASLITTQRLSKTVWTAEVKKMVKFGAPLKPAQQSALVDYLARYLGTRVSRLKVVPEVTAPPITFAGPPSQ